jgi:hypothetical protein
MGPDLTAQVQQVYLRKEGVHVPCTCASRVMEGATSAVVRD